MKTLIIYDSQYGNTEKLAKELASEAGSGAVTVQVGKASNSVFSNYGLVFFGCPTQGGRPTKAMAGFLSSLSSKELKGVKVAVFDTRFEEREQKLGLRLLMKTIGYAAPKLAVQLKALGAIVVSENGFLVTGKEGPLKTGEVKRAQEWMKSLTR